MTTAPQPPAGKKVARAAGAKPRPGFDLGHPTAPTAEPEVGPLPAAPPSTDVAHPVQQPAGQPPTYLGRSDNTGAAPGGAPQPAPAAGGGAGGPVINLGALVPQVDPEADMVAFNADLPRYMVAAIELMVKANYGTSKKKEHLRRALAGYIPQMFLDTARAALYPHLGAPPQ